MATRHPKFTVTDAANRFRRSTARICQICLDNEIGKVIGGRVRILSTQDVKRIGKIIEETGYPGISEKNSGIQ